MAKEFYTNGTGSSQTLNPSDESKIRIYDSKADADLDLANIEENEIIATKAGESEGVVEVVDTVEEDNPNPVSSGGVYDYVNEVQVVDLSNYITSSVTLAANGAHAYIHGKHVEIVAHVNKASASTTGGFPAIAGINGIIPMPKDDGFIVGSLYAAQGSNYYSGFCGYNKTSDSLGIYLTQAAAAGSYFQLNINYIGD